MKKETSQSRKGIMQRFFDDESAQGTAEYIMLIAAVVAIFVIFRDQITNVFRAQVGSVTERFGSAIDSTQGQ